MEKAYRFQKIEIGVEAARKPKQDLNLAEETLHHAAPCCPSAAHDKTIRTPKAHGPMSASALECRHPMLSTLLERQPGFWHLQHPGASTAS